MHARVWVSSAHSMGRLNVFPIDVDVGAFESDLILVHVVGCAEVELEVTGTERDSDDECTHKCTLVALPSAIIIIQMSCFHLLPSDSDTERQSGRIPKLGGSVMTHRWQMMIGYPVDHQCTPHASRKDQRFPQPKAQG